MKAASKTAKKTAERDPDEERFLEDDAKARADLDRSTLAFELIAEMFTTQELGAVHEAIRGESLYPGNVSENFLRAIDDGLLGVARNKGGTRVGAGPRVSLRASAQLTPTVTSAMVQGPMVTRSSAHDNRPCTKPIASWSGLRASRTRFEVATT